MNPQIMSTGDLYTPGSQYFDEDTKQRILAAKQMGMSDAEIELKATEYMAKKAMLSQQQEAAKPDFADKVANWLPVAGAVAGSFIPGAGNIVGGALGAGAGTLLKQAVHHEDTDWKEVGTEAALAGAGGLLFKGAGALAGKVLPKIGSKVAGAGTKLRAGVAKIHVPGSIWGDAEEKAIKATLEGLNIGGSSATQYAVLQPAYDDLGMGIKKLLATSLGEQKVSSTALRAGFKSAMKKSMLVSDITSTQANKAITGFLDDMVAMSGKSGNFANITPEDLVNWKGLINGKMGPIFKKIEAGGALTAKEQVYLAGWDAIDEVVSRDFTPVKELLTKQSHLYKAAQSLNVSRKTVPTSRIAGTTIPKEIAEGAQDLAGKGLQKVGGAVSNLKGIPTGALPQIGVAGGALVGQSMQNAGDQPQATDSQVIQGGDSTGQESQNENSVQGTTNYITGYSPEQLMRAQMKAEMAGDSKSATMLKNWYKVETDYQKTSGSGGGLNVGKVTAQNYSNASSGATSLDESLSLMFNPDGSLDTATIMALKTPFTPSQKARQLKAKLYNVADSYLRLRTGAQANPSEIKKLADSLEPGVMDTAETVKTKLNIYNTVFSQIIQLSQQGAISGETTPLDYSEGE